MNIEIVNVPSRHVIGLEHAVDFATDLPLYGVIMGLYARIEAIIGDGPHPGHQVILYRPTGPTTARMLVGRDWEGVDPEGVVVFDTPGGRVARTRHVGEYSELTETHTDLLAWLIQHGHKTSGVNWEVYLDWSDDPTQRFTDVCYSLVD